MTADGLGHSQRSRSLVEALAGKDIDAVRALFSGRADVDDPFHGHQVDGGFEDLCTDWTPVRGARVRGVEVAHSTSADGNAATELVLELERDGEERTLPLVVVSDLAADGRLVNARLYYRRARIDGRQHFRDRVLQEEVEHSFHPLLAEYQRALRERDPDAFLATFEDGAYFDGHGEAQDLSEGLGMGLYRGKEEIAEAVRQMMSIGKQESPGGRLEHVNAFSDGTTTVLEFNILKPEISRVHAGVACYELGAGGLIHAARVYDEAW